MRRASRIPSPGFAAAVLLSVAALVACAKPHPPSGPAPLYEEPPSPSWLEAGAGPQPSPTTADAGAI